MHSFIYQSAFCIFVFLSPLDWEIIIQNNMTYNVI